ncbi:MAG: ROK family transcriptional regulator [Lentisphaeraceae bacterium]|nr:ROK family transcriptional regulator [Lentisphaeraceae bacterium]
MNKNNAQISEQTRKRLQNRYAILRTLQSVGPMKRSEVAEYCGIRKSSVTSLVEELLEQQWIRLEDDKRPRSPLMINDQHHRVLTVELDVNCIHISKINLLGQIVELHSFDVNEDLSREQLLEALVTNIQTEIAGIDALLGIAVSAPGLVDSEKGICINAINLNDFTNVPLFDILTEHFDCPVIIENDVRASLYSSVFLERRQKPLDNALYLDITSGVGSALLVHGTPLVGSNGASGEIGHLIAGRQNRLCRCGQYDCLETYASIPAICHDINKAFGLELQTSEDIVIAQKKEAGISEILKAACEHIAIPLSVMMAALDPEVVILGNQPRSFYELLLPYLKDSLSSRLNGPAARSLDIELACDQSSMRGVAMLLVDKLFQQ